MALSLNTITDFPQKSAALRGLAASRNVTLRLRIDPAGTHVQNDLNLIPGSLLPIGCYSDICFSRRKNEIARQGLPDRETPLPHPKPAPRKRGPCKPAKLQDQIPQ